MLISGSLKSRVHRNGVARFYVLILYMKYVYLNSIAFFVVFSIYIHGSCPSPRYETILDMVEYTPYMVTPPTPPSAKSNE